jgi:uncharacterized membrane protein YkvA (DUF1232 family)
MFVGFTDDILVIQVDITVSLYSMENTYVLHLKKLMHLIKGSLFLS